MHPTNPLRATVAGQTLLAPRHICCFFDSRAQQYEVLAPYIAEGLDQGEKVLNVLYEHLIDDHHQRLCDAGIAVGAARESGRLCTHASDQTYLADGHFDKARMLAMLTHELKTIREQGFTRLRTCGDMNWMLKHAGSTEQILAYESDVNDLLEGHDATFMCVYDVNRISGTLMRDVLNTHSQVLMGSLVYENPYYLAPAEYRRSLLARRAATADVWAKDDVHT